MARFLLIVVFGDTTYVEEFDSQERAQEYARTHESSHSDCMEIYEVRASWEWSRDRRWVPE